MAQLVVVTMSDIGERAIGEYNDLLNNGIGSADRTTALIPMSG